jgi:hypothetical protein
LINRSTCSGLVALLTSCTLLACPLEATPYRAIYTAKYNGMSVKAVRELQKTDRGYRIISSVIGLLGGINEQENFHIDESGRIKTDDFFSEKSIVGTKSIEKLVVNHDLNSAVYTRKKKIRELHNVANYLGPVSYQLQLRHDLKTITNTVDSRPPTYQVMSRGRVKDYIFEVLGEELLDTGVGRLKTLKVQRVRDDSKRQTVLWMAPDWGFLIVKIWQKDSDGEDYEMLLETANFGGHTVTPLP